MQNAREKREQEVACFMEQEHYPEALRRYVDFFYPFLRMLRGLCSAGYNDCTRRVICYLSLVR